MRPKLVVVGSLNIDIVVKTRVRPRPGETVLGEYHRLIPGGKGANQACAGARLGAEVCMIGCVGDDELKNRTMENLIVFGVDCSSVRTLENEVTGAAFITVDPTGQNSIIVSGGANGRVTVDMIDQSRGVISGAGALLVQLETPLPAVERAVKIARDAGVQVVVNPAPAAPLPEGSLLWEADVFVVNEHEAEFYTGMPVRTGQDALAAGRRLRERGARTVLVTLGENGSVAATESGTVKAEAVPVTVVDTTAAGDTYIGGFCVEWLRTGDVTAALRFASAAAGISVGKFGAQSSIPDEQEVRNFL